MDQVSAGTRPRAPLRNASASRLHGGRCARRKRVRPVQWSQPDASREPAMVFAVQCPEPRCRKFMLVEEEDRGNVVACLICKTPIRVGGSSGQWTVKSDQKQDAGSVRPNSNKDFEFPD